MGIIRRLLSKTTLFLRFRLSQLGSQGLRGVVSRRRRRVTTLVSHLNGRLLINLIWILLQNRRIQRTCSEIRQHACLVTRIHRRLLLVSPRRSGLFFPFLRIVSVSGCAARIFTSLHVVWHERNTGTRFPPFVVESNRTNATLRCLLIHLPWKLPLRLRDSRVVKVCRFPRLLRLSSQQLIASEVLRGRLLVLRFPSMCTSALCNRVRRRVLLERAKRSRLSLPLLPPMRMWSGS